MVCVYVCACACYCEYVNMCIVLHMRVHIYVQAKGQMSLLSGTIHHYLKEGLALASLPLMQFWLAREPEGSACFLPPSTQIVSMCTHI